MDGKMKKFLIADSILLLILLLLSSTNIIAMRQKTEIYRIAVLTDAPGGRQLENFRAGVGKAAVDWAVDIGFISLWETEDAVQKRAALQKEIENGCRGVVLQCGNSAHVTEMLEDVPIGIPVVLYDCEADSARVRVRVGGDAEEESRLLAEAVLAGRTKGESVTIVEPTYELWYTEWLHGLAEERLREAGVLVRRVTLEETATAETLVKGMAAQGGNILVSCDATVLQALGEANGEAKVPLYGAGFTGAMHALLENGAICGTALHRDYEAGYLAVDQAARILQGKGGTQEMVTVESAWVTAETLTDKKVESVVFPYI